MYPMYSASDEHRRLEDGLNCFMNGTTLSKVLSFSPVHNSENEHEDGLSQSFCQEMKLRYKTPAAKYDDIDCELDHYQKTALSAYQNDHGLNHCHHIPEPKHYHHQQQSMHQHYRVHHRRNFYNANSDKHTSLDLYNKNSTSPPKCVQQHRGNGKNNNYYKTADRYTEGPEPPQELECSHSKYFDDDYERTLSEDHYQHYYSYYYNPKPNTSKSSHKQDRGRKLPSTRKMPFQKNSLMSDRSASGEYGNHVLKEKSINNNKVASYDSGDWEYDSFKVIGSSGNYAKDMETHEFENSKYYDGCSHLYKIKQSTMISNFSPNSDSQDIEEGVQISNNNFEEVDHQLSSEEDGQSPEKYSAVTLKKTSSPSKGRRVLIYNSQSPRLSQLISHKRVQRPKPKLQNDPKENLTSQKTSECRTRILQKLSPPRIANRTEGTSKAEYKNETKYSSEESDSEIDLDTASEFEVSGDSDISSDSEECYRSHAFKLTHSLDAVSTSVSVISSLNSTESLSNPDTLLVPSLFPNVPPYLAFSSSTKKGPDVPADLYRILKWRVTSVMPRVVRTVLANSGMRLLKKTNDWMGVWGKHMKSPCFKTIRPYQKINHLPGSFKIGRKDSCWKNLVKQMAKHGKKEFGFMPKTYIIPNDLKQLRKSWPKYSQRNVKWIIKPPASARGSGIRVVDRWAQIPKRKSLIVQKYIERPLLINGSKFDLRLYVLVTSIHPLRVYMYHNGLARFASVKYSDKSDTLSDRCMHLTNYSINKFSSNYSKNEDVNACHGHKWTIKSLWNYLANRGVRTELLWEALRSLVLRTILAGENSINNMIRTNVESKYSCFELFGFDVLLDSELIPWLLEVNISPSLHSELPLDAHVKAPLVQCVLNTALYNIPPKISIERQKEIAAEMSLPPGPICYDKRIYVNYLSRSEKIKHSTYTRKTMEDRDMYICSILDHLTPDDVRCLIIAEDELARSSPLERIFPTADTHKYLKYTETPRYYNRLLDAWETRYSHNRDEGIAVLRQLCDERYHLQVPQIPTKKPLKYRTRAIMKITRPTSLSQTVSANTKWRLHKQNIRLAHQSRTTTLERCVHEISDDRRES